MALACTRATKMLVACLIAAAPATALAQAAVQPGAGAIPPISPQSLNPAALAPPPRQQSERDVFSAPEAGPCKIGENQLTFALKSVEFRTAKGFSTGDLSSAYEREIGQTISLKDVCTIRDRAQALLFRRDMLARVDIPPQALSDGKLLLQVTVARIASVIVKGDGGPAQAKVEDYLEHLRGKTFDIATVQRYLFLSSDIPGVRLQAALRPAPGGEGEVDLIVTVETKPIDVAVNVQNFGSEALGRWGGLARVDINGLTSWGERTSLIAYSTLFDDEQRVFQAIEEVRLGDTGLIGRLSFSYGDSHPGAALAPLDLHGSSYVTDLSLIYPLIRSRARDLNLIGGIDSVDQKTTVGGAATLNDDHLRVLFARVSGRQAWRQHELFGLFDNAELIGGLEARQGLSGLGASSKGDPLLSRIEADPRALALRADARLDLQWTHAISTRFVASGQYSDKVLLSYEDYAVGDLTIGRGYDPSSLTGDKGYGGSAEVRLAPAALLPPSEVRRLIDAYNTSFFAFADAARVENISTGGLNRTVHSLGGGVSFRVWRNVRADVTYAHPIDRVAPSAPSRPSDRILLNLTAAVF